MKKIVILGPEGTGKSTLAAQLAAHYNTVWCPEYAREYLLKHGTNYSFNNLLTIAQGQVQLEETLVAEARNNLFFIDTDMYVMKVWCEVVFNDCHPWILQQIAARHHDFYLLCNTDLPWVQDGLREYPDEEVRRRLFKTYHDIVVNSNTPWAIVSGTHTQRLQSAIAAIETFLQPAPIH